MKNLRIIKRTTCIGAAAALAILLAGCSSERGANEMTSYSSTESKTDTAALFTIPQDQMSHVQVVTVQASKLTRTLRLTGAVAYNAFSTTPVITQVGGPVAKILVVPGDRVKRGQPLLEVSSPDYSLLLAAYLKARDTFRVANKNYERAQDLFAHHAIADRDLLQAESDRIQAQADLSAAEEGMKILGIPKPEDLEKSPISAQIPLLAPIGGEIVERLVSPGQVMQAGTTQAFTISDMSTVWVMANIYQGDLAYVKTGDPATITTDSYPDKFSGKISFISAALDPTTRTLQARIVVDNPGGKLKKDMYCVATVTAGTISNAIAVPDSSILRDDENQPFVYVASSSNLFGRRQVDIGQTENGQTQVLKGLSPGDKVAANGSLFLQFANSFQH
ncbi:MAG: efflux RND transporter periplasmic adaptor subunit [Candidatus Acidiferrales bacterium]|jgi:cobalt-zinc-cadmium efflux system membrane fusion protein